jgi:hypothetical protein
MAESKAPTPAPTPAPNSDDLDTVARLGAQRRKFKDAAKRLTEERDGLKKELDELKAKPVDPSAMQLRAELREIKHRKVFDRIASELRARPEALDDLWKLSGYTPETDIADEVKLKEVIGEQAKTRAYLFDSGTTPADGGKPLIKPAVGGGQGVNTVGAPQISQHDPSDVAFWFSRFDEISAAAQERVNRGEV